MPKEFDATQTQNKPFWKVEGSKSDSDALFAVKSKLWSLVKGAGDLGNTIAAVPSAAISALGKTDAGKAATGRTLDKVKWLLTTGYDMYKKASPEVQAKMRDPLMSMAKIGTKMWEVW
jgi:hypothetical protein